jgi:hypothetical protein
VSEKPNGDEFWRLMARYLPVLGLMPGYILAGYLIGAGLDHVFSTTYLKLVCIVLGVVGGVIQLLRILARDK